MKRMQPVIAAFAAAVLSGCTTTSAEQPQVAAVTVSMSAGRELTADEKKVIADSLLDNIREPEKAKYRWAPFPANAPVNGQARYCAIVNARSVHAPYNGLQPYLVVVQVANGQIVSSTLGAIAGGNDKRIVHNLCAKQGLNPDDAR